MTKRERLSALLSGQPPDGVVLFPFLLGFCARNVGYPIETIYSNPEQSFDAQIQTLEQYDFDWGPIYGYASYGTWEFGGEIEMPKGGYQQAPSPKRFPVSTEAELEGLEQPDVRTAGCLPLAMRFSRLQDQAGTKISVVLGGNFTLAGNLCSAERLCRWILKKPDLAHRVMRLATEHIIRVVQCWADTFGPERVIPQFWEPLASNVIISPRHFDQFALPYLSESARKILEMGVRHILYHICGEQKANLPSWAKVPMGDPGLCSFGEEVDLEKAIEHLGDKAIIIGNIDPKRLLKETPNRILELCREAISKGKKAPRGFMLSSGCEVSPETPAYHLYLMGKAAREFGGDDR